MAEVADTVASYNLVYVPLNIPAVTQPDAVNVPLIVVLPEELITFIKENPSILKRPIMVDDRRIQVGYNEEEIRTFIPREAREIAFKACSKENCEKFDTCEHAQFKKENGEC